MQPRILSRVAHPTFLFILVFTLTLGPVPLPSVVGFAYATPGEQKIYYYLPDHLGGVDKVTDEQGNVVCNNDYLPFGDLRRGDCTENDENHGFTGKEKDPETDLYYYGARYYDPTLGRFVSPDPLSNALDTMNSQELNDFLKDPQNLNPYSYVKNNPLRYTDPTGQYEEDVHYDLTYALSLYAGLSSDTAKIIASHDQGMDENPATAPIAEGAGIFNGVYRTIRNFITGETKKNHFLTRKKATKKLDNAIASSSPEAVGDAMHPFQDSYSHEGFEFFSNHVFFGHEPDKTYNDVEQANAMAQASFYQLRTFNLKINGTGGLSLDQYNQATEDIWNATASVVDEYNKSINKLNTAIHAIASGSKFSISTQKAKEKK